MDGATAEQGDASPQRAGRAGRWLLAGILVLALALRLRGFVSFPLEGDEIFTFFEATDLFGTDLQPGIEARPLHYLLQHALFWLGPDRHPAMLRMLPLVFGMAGVWATWRLGRRVSGTVAAAVGALMVAVSPWHLYASGMARYWALVYLLACLGFHRLLVARASDRWRDHLLAFAVVAAGIATHPTFLFPLAGVALGLHLRPGAGEDGWRWEWPSRSALLGFWGPLVGLLAAAFVALSLTGNSGAVRNWRGRPLIAVARLIPAMVQWATPVVCVAGLLGAAAPVLDRRAPDSERRWVPVAWLGLLSTVSLLGAAALMTDVYADYGIAALPLVLVSSGVLAQTVARRFGRDRSWAAAFVAALLVTGAAPSSASHLSDGTRFDYRPAFDRIEEAAPELPVLIQPMAQLRWYAPDLDGRRLSVDMDEAPPELPDGGAWAVVGVRRYGIPGDESGAFRRWLSRRCDLEGAWEGLRFDYRRYRVELHRCTAAG